MLTLSSPGWGQTTIMDSWCRKTRSEGGSKVKRETQARGQFQKEILENSKKKFFSRIVRLKDNVRQA